MNDDAVLLVMDVQNDFLPGGTLAVPRGDEIVPVVNSAPWARASARTTSTVACAPS